jgi:hypothetical protein
MTTATIPLTAAVGAHVRKAATYHQGWDLGYLVTTGRVRVKGQQS